MSNSILSGAASISRQRLGLFLKFLVPLALALTAACPGRPANDARQFVAPVESFADGDSFTVNRDGNAVRIRMNLIDAPELHQEFGAESRENLVKLVGGSRVLIVPVDRDRYGRTIADVYVDEKNIGLAQIYDGFAWYYRVKSMRRDDYQAAEQQARGQNRGLWHSAAPKPPWEWRKEHPRNGN